MMKRPDMQVLLIPPPKPLRNGKNRRGFDDEPENQKPKIFARDTKMVSPNVLLYETHFLQNVGGVKPVLKTTRHEIHEVEDEDEDDD
jgi:hypothetical protein